MNVLNRFFPSLLALASVFLALGTSHGQAATANYDEAKVPAYTLPDPLLLPDGERVTDAKTWTNVRRPQILDLFRKHVYGKSPSRPHQPHFHVESVDSQALGGKATRKQVSVFFGNNHQGPKMNLLLYLPNHSRKPVPAFLGLNFSGNHTIHSDPGILLAEVWDRNGKENPPVRKRAAESTRGSKASRWPVETIISRGYALATVYYGDITPDIAGHLQLGVHQLFGSAPALPEEEGWGSIAAWAWGLSRALDYLESDKAVDAKRVAVMGHSRLGKTALWAGAEDQRFAIVISNNSGCGGAALSRRRFGETVQRINTSFPHWFCGQFKKYNGNEDALPVDQHMLVALMAPRPVYIASAAEDLWADPKGEFLSAKHAEPVYLLLGTDGLGVREMPAVNKPVMGTIGYHIRSGKHDVTDYDWQQYLAFADKHMK